MTFYKNKKSGNIVLIVDTKRETFVWVTVGESGSDHIELEKVFSLQEFKDHRRGWSLVDFEEWSKDFYEVADMPKVFSNLGLLDR